MSPTAESSGRPGASPAQSHRALRLERTPLARIVEYGFSVEPRYFRDTIRLHDGGVLGTTPDGTLTGELYYVGLIDVLMRYTFRKKVETAVKKVNAGEQEVSSAPPDHYAQRLIAFVVQHSK